MGEDARMHQRPKRRATRPTIALVILLALAGLAWSCGPRLPPGGTGPGPAFRDPDPVGSIGHIGRWMVDATGRVVLLRGANFVMKNAPYYPAAAGFDDDDAAWLKVNGFDAVRLGVTGTGLMPQPGVIDGQLLDRVGKTIEVLTAHHLYVLLDLHQDGWGERANGEPLGSDGFPEWMTLTNGAPNTHTDFPYYYLTNPAIPAAFQSLWDDVEGPDRVSLQTSVAKMFGALADHFGRNPRVLGYDSFNEPWPGPNWVPCATPPAGCPDQDHASLDPLYAKITNAIRASDRRHLVFGEPFVLFNFGVATSMSLPGGDARSGMSFHLYAATPASEPVVVKSALDWSAATGGALLNTEWGATDDTAAITRQADLLDGALIPWMYWSYDEEIVPDLHRTPGGANLSPQTSAIVRPHPIAVAGTPTAMHYDATTKAFDFSWSTRRAGGGFFLPGTVTSVSIPTLIYPNGYSVQVQGARVTSRPCAPTLTVAARFGAPAASVHVTPGGTCPPAR